MQSSKRKITTLITDDDSQDQGSRFIEELTEIESATKRLKSLNDPKDSKIAWFSHDMSISMMQNQIYDIAKTDTLECAILRILAKLLPKNDPVRSFVELHNSINLDELRKLFTTIKNLRYAAGIASITSNPSKQFQMMALSDTDRYDAFREALTQAFQPDDHLEITNRSETEDPLLKQLLTNTKDLSNSTPIPPPTITEVQEWIHENAKPNAENFECLRIIAKALPQSINKSMTLQVNTNHDLEIIREAFNNFNGIRKMAGIKSIRESKIGNAIVLNDRPRYLVFYEALKKIAGDEQEIAINNIPFKKMDLIQTMITIEEIACNNHKFYNLLKKLYELLGDRDINNLTAASKVIVDPEHFREIRSIVYSVPDLYSAIGIKSFREPNKIYLDNNPHFVGFMTVLNSLFNNPLKNQLNHPTITEKWHNGSKYSFATKTLAIPTYDYSNSSQGFSQQHGLFSPFGLNQNYNQNRNHNRPNVFSETSIHSLKE